MEPQTTVETQQLETAEKEARDDTLEARVARLEAAVAALQEVVDRLLAPSEGPVYRLYRKVKGKDESYFWVEPPDYLKGVTDYSQFEPEELVYIYELTNEDIRLRLEQLERWYGMSSEAFYERWQQGEADDILHKIEWSALYEDWQRIQTESSKPNEEST